jgi:hypothetical protein
MLTNLMTGEVSLVRSPANRKAYAIAKSETPMLNIGKAAVETPVEGEEQLVAALKSAGANAKRIEAAVASLRVQKNLSDVYTDEDMAAVAAAMNPVAKAKMKKDEEKEEEDEEDEDLPAFLKDKKAKKAKKSDEPASEELSPAAKAHIERVEKANSELHANVGVLTKLVEGLVEKNQTAHFVTKAATDFSHVPGSSEEIAAVLKSAHAADPKTGAAVEKLLGTVQTLVQKSGLMGSFGSPGAGAGQATGGGSAMQTVEQMASALTMKSDSGKEMTREQKIAYVIKSTPEGRAAYRQYLMENEAQRSKYGI